MLVEAIALDQEALKVRPEMAEAHFNWAFALGERSKRKSGDEAKALFEEARAQYDRAHDLDPTDAEVFFNLGNLYGDRAEALEDGDEAWQLLRDAIDAYSAGLSIKGDDPDYLANRGATFKALADRTGNKSDWLGLAERDLKLARKLRPTDPSFPRTLAEVQASFADPFNLMLAFESYGDAL